MTIKKCVGVVVLLLVAVPCVAQPTVVASVKAALQDKGVDLSGPCGAFQITKRVAWQLRAQGAGYIQKRPEQNNCELHGVDIVMFPDGRIVDILTDSGNANGPSWDTSKPPVPVTLWEAPVDPGDAPMSAPPPSASGSPAPIIVTTPAIDWSAVLAAIADVRAAQERIFAADKVGERVDALGQRVDQRADELKAAIDSPGWFRSVMSNRYVQLAIVGLGSYAATHQAMK